VRAAGKLIFRRVKLTLSGVNKKRRRPRQEGKCISPLPSEDQSDALAHNFAGVKKNAGVTGVEKA